MWITGEQATFTYAPDGSDPYGMSTAAAVSLTFIRWGMESVLELHETTPLGHRMAMYTEGVLRVRGVLEGLAETKAPGVPDGGPGLLTLTLASGVSYAVRARLFRLSVAADPNGNGVSTTYAYVGSSDVKHDTLKVT